MREGKIPLVDRTINTLQEKLDYTPFIGYRKGGEADMRMF